MRIAVVGTYGVKCGIATYANHLVQELAKQHEVMVFAEDYVCGNELLDFLSDVKIVRCFSRNSQSSTLLKELQAFAPDIVHIQHEYGIFGALRHELDKVAMAFEGRIIVTLHTVVPIVEGIVFDMPRSVACYVVHNSFAKNHLVEKDGIAANKVAVIGHGTLILPPMDKSEARQRFDLPQESKIILSHSFIEKRKNIDKIMMATSLLKDELPIYYVHAGGLHPNSIGKDMQDAQSLLQLPRKLNIEPWVRIVAAFINEDDLACYLSAADIIIVMEDSTFPEFRASGIMHTVVPGKAVIASDIPEFNEFPNDAVYKVSLDENALSKAIKEILLHPDLADRLAQSLLRYANDTSWQSTAVEHIQLYQKVLQQAHE